MGEVSDTLSSIFQDGALIISTFDPSGPRMGTDQLRSSPQSASVCKSPSLWLTFGTPALPFGTPPLYESQSNSQLAHCEMITLQRNSDRLLFSQLLYLFSLYRCIRRS